MVTVSPEKAGVGPREGEEEADDDVLTLGEPADERDHEPEEFRYQVEDMVDEESSPSASAAERPDDGRPRPTVHHIELDEDRIDADAAKVVRRLVRAGYEAYLVGGCVRDLLLGRRPKDFDVCTSARPDDVRRLFRNSRVIGRRFRLVHVIFGPKVIETATFRRAPEAEEDRGTEDLLIRNDNVFGEAHQDARRRDFTINALFYDLERNKVLDWVGGMPDIERRAVHTIGKPLVRFLEDPVRILRAIKFSAKLDLGITPETYDAIVEARKALARAAKPRLFEEILRLMREGAAHRALFLCWETGVLDVLLPELSTFLADREEDDDRVWQLLQEIDRRTIENGPLDDVVLWTVLLAEPLREACDGARDRVEMAHEFLEGVVDRLNVPRRIAESIRRIVALMPRLESGRGGRFSRTPLYPVAMEVLDIYRSALGDAAEGAFDAPEGPSDAAAIAASSERRPKRRRRRRRS
ncbi:MAG TPA: polynucleotide adenylyltransferase PcnB [Polyangiaceae bacterium]|nr:polynucleotide adenylyltransferase PcnB [Polyangiaceae bacterium]